MARLVLSLLGPFEASLDGRAFLRSGLGKSHALLVYLVVESGKAHRRSALAELFWPEQPPERGRHRLRQMLLDLQKALRPSEDAGEAPFLMLDKESMRFSAELAEVDVATFTSATDPCRPAPDRCARCLPQMEAKIGLYRGEFMAGLSLFDCPEFEEWLQLQRESLHRRAISVLEQLANCYEQTGNLAHALRFALRHVELAPWDEFAHRRVMQLHALTGHTNAAMRQYDNCCQLLETELGALPSQETRQLAERIRAGEFRRETVPVAVLPPVQTATPLERRQVTILYCELSITATGDPDEAMAILNAPQASCMKIIRSHSGHIVQTHGGGLLAYFGYPRADEYAARHAVQAALAATHEAFDGIEVRAGVHTGLIIAGSDPAMPDVVGKSSRIAIFLRQAVAGNEVAISEESRRLVAGYFDCQSLGTHHLHGIDQPMEIHRVLSASGAQTRLEAAAHLTSFTGRKAEIDQLMALWKKAVRGTPRTVLLRGEAGMGKSRLLHRLKERLASQPHAIRELRCFPEFSQSPLHPVIAMLEDLCGIEHHDTPAQKFAKLGSLLEAASPDTAMDTVPLLAALLSLPVEAPYRVRTATPQQQKENTISALLDLLHHLSERQPVLLIVEDLHWVDPSTLELLTALIRQKRKAPILAVLTARPEFLSPWADDIDTHLDLAPLERAEAERMITSIGARIPTEVGRQIVARADGVPLFIEEMAKIAATDDLAGIPTTLSDLLAARLDAMGEAKYVAQIAATIGREFDLDLLSRACPPEAGAPSSAIVALEGAGLVLPVRIGVKQFKHALLQEAVYLSQARPVRQAAHRRIAEVLLDGFPDRVTTRPEVVAQHLAEAGETRLAIEYWIKAGRRAAKNSAGLEASGHFDAALRLLISLPANQARDETEFTILTNLCPVLYATKGYGSEEATKANTRLSALRGLQGDSRESFVAEWARVMNAIAGVGSRDVSPAANRLLAMAKGDPLREQAAHYAVANAAFWRGDFATTRTHTEQALALYHTEQQRLLLELYNEELSVSCAAYLAWSLYFLGYPNRAQQACDRMLAQARELDHPHTLALALCFASVLHRWLNKRAETLRLSAETIAVSRQHNFLVWLAAGEMTHGWALAMHGRKDEGLAELHSSIAGMKAAIGGISIVFLSALLEGYVHLEMYDEALGVIEEAQADTTRTGDGHYTAELYRLQGECLLAISPANIGQSETCFDQALAISHQQDSNSLELRAATSLARLWLKQGRADKAQRLLSKTYGRLTEGFDSNDAIAAKAMFD